VRARTDIDKLHSTPRNMEKGTHSVHVLYGNAQGYEVVTLLEQ